VLYQAEPLPDGRAHFLAATDATSGAA